MRYDFDIPQGTDVRRIFSLKSSCTRQTIDLTMCKARMQIRTNVYATRYCDTIDSTVDDGRCTIDEKAGTVTIIWPHELTSSLPVGRLFYDLEIESAGGEIARVLEGQITVTAEVTRV